MSMFDMLSRPAGVSRMSWESEDYTSDMNVNAYEMDDVTNADFDDCMMYDNYESESPSNRTHWTAASFSAKSFDGEELDSIMMQASEPLSYSERSGKLRAAQAQAMVDNIYDGFSPESGYEFDNP